MESIHWILKSPSQSCNMASQDLKNHSDRHDLDFDLEVEAVENKIPGNPSHDLRQPHRLAARAIGAAHIQRPFALDPFARCFAEWVELPTGTAFFGDDKAMPSGLAKIGRHRCVSDHASKGPRHQGERETEFRLRPSRGLSQGAASDAARGRVWAGIISLIDTPGAFPGIGSEERHISERHDRGQFA